MRFAITDRQTCRRFDRGLRVICEMRIAKLRKGNLRNRLRNALWLVDRN